MKPGTAVAGASAAERRALRAIKAAKLLVLLSDKRQQGAVDNDPITWALIDSLPQWIGLDANELHELRYVIGCLVIAPYLQQCIDGSALRECVECIDEEQFHTILTRQSFDLELENVSLHIDNHRSLSQAMSYYGASVLLTLIPSNAIRQTVAAKLNWLFEVLPIEYANACLSEVAKLTANHKANTGVNTSVSNTETEISA